MSGSDHQRERLPQDASEREHGSLPEHVGAPRGWDDQHIELLMGNLLRVGVTIASIVVLVGGILYLAESGQQREEDMHHFAGEPAELRSIGGICQGVVARDPRAVIQFGLLLLVATPVARVVFALVAFARQRNRTYVVVSALVLVMLGLGLFGF
jgi:uncharacterized membrane protein